ncbi:MAG: hypothetical protein JRC68_10080 [Deltaproteobacteria bacterium]|nr:hypothetical protein [Deltaproteobacteria bacterium]
MADNEEAHLIKLKTDGYGRPLPIPKEYFQNNSNFVAFRRFFHLSPRFEFEDGSHSPCGFLRDILTSSFRDGSRELTKRLESTPDKCHQAVKTCTQCIEFLYPLIPQKFKAPDLAVSEFLMGLKNNNIEKQGFVGKQNNSYYTKNITVRGWSSNNMLWFAGEELFQADKIWWGKFGVEILKEGALNAPLGEKIQAVIGPISFFYDHCPDLVYAFFCDTGSPLDSTRHLTGLTYAMSEARKAWLFDWVGELAETIMKMEHPEEFVFLA